MHTPQAKKSKHLFTIVEVQPVDFEMLNGSPIVQRVFRKVRQCAMGVGTDDRPCRCTWARFRPWEDHILTDQACFDCPVHIREALGCRRLALVLPLNGLAYVRPVRKLLIVPELGSYIVGRYGPPIQCLTDAGFDCLVSAWAA